jgi:hypothetical protein
MLPGFFGSLTRYQLIISISSRRPTSMAAFRGEAGNSTSGDQTRAPGNLPAFKLAEIKQHVTRQIDGRRADQGVQPPP